MLRPDARELGLRDARRCRSVRRFVRVFAGPDVDRRRPSGSCVGDGARPVRRRSPRGRRRGLPRARRGARAARVRAARSSWSTSSASRTSAPPSRTASPTTRRATRCGCCGSATRRCGCCAPCAGSISSSCRRRETCCGFGGTFAVKNADTSAAMLTDKLRARARHAAPRSARGRQLVPDAHRRRSLARAGRRAHDAPGRDPGVDGMTRDGFPDGARASALRDAQLRRNLRQGDDARSATSARPSSRRSTDWEALREAGAAIKARRCAATSMSTSSSSRRPCSARGRRRPLGARRRRGERDRRRARRASGRDEVIKVKSLTTDEIGLNEALAARGHPRDRDRPRRADRPARATTARRTSSCRRSTSTGREIRELFRAHAARRRARRDDPRGAGGGRAALPARDVPARARRDQRRELRRRRDGHGLRRRVRGQRPHVHDACRETLITVMGIEKVLPRFADLEVMLQLLPRSSTGERMNPYTSLWTGVTRGRRPAGVPPRPARQRAHAGARRPSRPRRAALHPLLARASTSARSTSATGGHAYGSTYPGPIGAILAPQLDGLERARRPPVRELAVRRLLRGLPGEDRHPVDPRPPARRVVRRRAPAPARARARWRCTRSARVFASRRRYEPAQRARAARRRARCRATGGSSASLPGPLRRLDGGARPAGAAAADLPRVVAGAPRVTRCSRGGAAAALTGGPRRRPPRWRGAGPRAAPTTRCRDASARPARRAALELFVRARAPTTGPTVVRVRRRRRCAAEVAARAASATGRAASLDPRVALPAGWRAGRPRVAARRPPLGQPSSTPSTASLTGCALAIAETGTIVLDAGAGQGRRALTLLPDLHVCVVAPSRSSRRCPRRSRASPAAPARAGRSRSSPGPSATSDIELERVEGVHGPRRLVVIVVSASEPASSAPIRSSASVSRSRDAA